MRDSAEDVRTTRRGLLKRATRVGAGVAIAGIAGNIGLNLLGSLGSSSSTARGADRPNLEHRGPGKGDRELTPDQYSMISALAAVIIPSDNDGPGAIDVDVVGRIDQMLKDEPGLQNLYARGLQSFEDLAQRQYRKSTLAIDETQCIGLMKLIEEAKLTLWVDIPDTLWGKLERKAHWYYYRWQGISEHSLHFFDRLINDVTAIFYSSQSAWNWLGYNGPPFPFGNIGRQKVCVANRPVNS